MFVIISMEFSKMLQILISLTIEYTLKSRTKYHTKNKYLYNWNEVFLGSIRIFGVVIDLSKSDVVSSQLYNSLERVQVAEATNIKIVIIMPKIRCVCDYVISLSEIPCPNQYYMISDISFERYFDIAIKVEELYNEMKIVVRCSNCERLHVFYNGFDNEPVIYQVDR